MTWGRCVALLLLLASFKIVEAQPAGASQAVTRFMGRKVTVVKRELDVDGSPKGPASVCLEAPPQRQRYIAPKDYGMNPEVEVIVVDKQTSALFFSAETQGGSGFTYHFALLRPGPGKDLSSMFFFDSAVSNQSQHAFWSEPSISEAKVFVTADWDFGPDETHYGEHRYIISAYTLMSSTMVDDPAYYLQDRFMTLRKYDLDSKADVLASEKQEILNRLRRVEAERKLHPPSPR